MRRYSLMAGLLLSLLWVVPTAAAQPKPKPASKSAAPLPAVEGDKLPPGQFGGILVSLPDSNRMFTLKVTYPEIRLKPGAKMPNLRHPQAKNINQQYQQMQRAQQVHHGRGRRGGNSAMQMQQMYMQNQQRMAQAMARVQQQQLQQLQQEIKAILSMYEAVPVTRDFDFQVAPDVKVRVNYLPEQFDDKGNIKSYSKQELAELKGKDKNLMGYESSPDDLKVGQTVVVALRAYKKPKPTSKLATPSVKDTDADKDKDKDPDADKLRAADKDKETDVSQHKMHVTIIVILKDTDALQNATTQSGKKK